MLEQDDTYSLGYLIRLASFISQEKGVHLSISFSELPTIDFGG